MFGAIFTRDKLKCLAQEASLDHLSNGTNLTEAVVKAASANPGLTSEHVRRICEMTYHDVYERMHKAASGADRYVSFDPPNASAAAEMLRATKVASAPRGKANLEESGGLMTTKTASYVRPKFTPANAFTEIMKKAEAPAPNWADPTKDVRDLRTDLKEATRSVETDLASVKTAHFLEMGQLIKEATSIYKEGHSIEDILHACFSGADWENIDPSCAQETATTVAEKVASAVNTVAGMPLNTSSSLSDVNPDHPLPSRFAKVAVLETERAHLELTLDELLKNRDYFNEKIESLYDRA
jgi:hypothetical protein